MVTLEDIKTSLLQNGNLTSEVKENIFELSILFHNQFPDVPLDNLSKRLQTLQIIKSNKFLNKDVSMYDFRKNTIYFNIQEIDKGYDMKHILMFELLNVITATEYQTGFNQNDKYEALNLGYTEILANFLVGNNSDKMVFPEEASFTNLISIMIGNDVLQEAYFHNNIDTLLKRVQEVGIQV